MNLFGEEESASVSIEQAAKQARVSSASIRNWIKSGLLVPSRKGMVTEESFAHFMKEIVGTEKLNSRANKQYKDLHECSIVLPIISNNTECDYRVIGERYEQSLSESYRNKEGIYYTPIEVVRSMMVDLDSSGISDSSKFCDPCCGSGNFLVAAIEAGVRPENVFGFDTDPNAVEISIERIHALTGYRSKQIVVADFLALVAGSSISGSYDYIFTNPPWGKKIEKVDKVAYARIFSTGTSQDTASLFFSACMHALRNEGRLSMLLPDSFFNISNFQDVRRKLINHRIYRLSDYGKPFKGLVTRAQAITVDKTTFKAGEAITCGYNGKEYKRCCSTLYNNPKDILNFWISESEARVVQRMFEKPHRTLKHNAKWGLGIVTGNNDKFCQTSLEDGYMPVWRGADIVGDSLRDPSVFIPADLSLYQQVAPVDIYESSEKLVYKFISSTLAFYYDSEQRYFLNSANMLVLSKSFPISPREVCKILNSSLYRWLFRAIFNTHKILRGDLEELPFHVDYYSQHDSFDEEAYLEFMNITRSSDGTYRLKE